MAVQVRREEQLDWKTEGKKILQETDFPQHRQAALQHPPLLNKGVEKV